MWEHAHYILKHFIGLLEGVLKHLLHNSLSLSFNFKLEGIERQKEGTVKSVALMLLKVLNFAVVVSGGHCPWE